MTRRTFIRQTTLAAGATALSLPAIAANAGPLGLPIGFQTWVVREKLARDFAGTLREMAGLGYQTLEMCSPPDYLDSGFGPLAKLTAKEMRRVIEDAGLRCDSCHYPFDGLEKNLDQRIAFAKELGLKQMVISSFWLKPEAKLDDWRRQCDKANRAGEKTLAAGLPLGFHNHHSEFEQLEGQLIYDVMMSALDPKLVRMQFQVAVISAGFKAADFFKKYPGRFLSAHLADWSPSDKKSVPLGQGIVDWKELFAAAKAGGLQNYYVEMDFPTLKPSCDYLRKLGTEK